MLLIILIVFFEFSSKCKNYNQYTKRFEIKMLFIYLILNLKYILLINWNYLFGLANIIYAW